MLIEMIRKLCWMKQISSFKDQNRDAQSEQMSGTLFLLSNVNIRRDREESHSVRAAAPQTQEAVIRLTNTSRHNWKTDPAESFSCWDRAYVNAAEKPQWIFLWKIAPGRAICFPQHRLYRSVKKKKKKKTSAKTSNTGCWKSQSLPEYSSKKKKKKTPAAGSFWADMNFT